MNENNTALDFVNVSVGYRGRPVIENLTLSLPCHDMAALIGPNGAGKTTFLRAVTGLVKPAKGTVRLFSEDVSALSPSARARLVSVIPQDIETPMAFTVAEIVMMGRTSAMSRWRQPTNDDRAIVEQAMIYADVIDMQQRPFTELSGGEKQRAIIAMALAQQPRMILMDEATSHLDMNHRLEIMRIIERLNSEQNVTVLMVSHDLNLAAEFCGRLMLLDHGRLVADGAPADVLRPDILHRVYHCDVFVQANPVSGSLNVFPVRSRPLLSQT